MSAAPVGPEHFVTTSYTGWDVEILLAPFAADEPEPAPAGAPPA